MYRNVSQSKEKLLLFVLICSVIVFILLFLLFVTLLTFQKLTKGSDSWSLAEVVHAIVLLAHFHSLASFVFGCGVNEEIDQRTEPLINKLDNFNDKTVVFSQLRDGWSETDTGVGVDTLMQRMKSLSERTEEFTAEERAKRFERVESQSVELATGTGGIRVEPSIGHFVDDPDFLYEDFARRGEVSDIPTFRVQVNKLNNFLCILFLILLLITISNIVSYSTCNQKFMFKTHYFLSIFIMISVFSLY